MIFSGLKLHRRIEYIPPSGLEIGVREVKGKIYTWCFTIEDSWNKGGWFPVDDILLNMGDKLNGEG